MSFVSRAASATACAAGLHRAARWYNRRRLLILCYHGVTDSPVPPDVPAWHHLHVTDFAQQMSYLQQHYQVLPIDEAIELLRRDALVRPTACLTFDDGYRNNGTVALPVLTRLKLPATVYLVTGYIGTTERLWTVRLEYALRRTPRTTLDLTALGRGSFDLAGPGARSKLARELIEHLKHQEPTTRQTLLSALFEQVGPVEVADNGLFEFMSWDEARRMAASGLITFGGHTAHHEIVGRLPDASLRAEIGTSISAVQSQLGAVSRTFAYPNGRARDFDARARGILQECGVSAALTTIEGLNTPSTEPYELRRVTIGSDISFAQFRAATSGLS